MFAKLKKKIVEEEGVGEGDLAKKYAAGAVSPLHAANTSQASRGHRGSTTSLSSQGSSSNLSGQALGPDSKKGVEATVASLQTDLSQRTDQVQRLESKLDEYSTLLKEVVKAKERLETVLDKQHEANTKRVQELNEEYQLRRAKMADKLALAVKRKEEEMNVQMQTLDKEKCDLQDQFQRLSMDKFKKQEESEELQGFQVQELAKVKHMFVNSQEELHQCRADLEHTQEKLDESCQQMQRLSTELGSARDDLNKLRKTRDELMKQKTSAEEYSSQQERLKKSLEERMHSLTIETNEKSNRLLSLEERLSSAQEEMDSLRHGNEAYRTQGTTQLLENKNTNRLLQEKVSVLEQRLQDHSLTDDEQMKAIMVERDTLEQRVEESRRELIDFKSSSAETISSLEQQISHLNAKIAEDSATLLEKQQRLESISRRHTEETSQLQAKLSDAEQQASAHLQLANQRNTQMTVQKSLSDVEVSATQEQLAETKRQSLEMKKLLQDKIAMLESKLTALTTATDFEKSASEHKITRLESQNGEYLGKEIEHEKRLTQLEEERDSFMASHGVKSQECERLAGKFEEVKQRSQEIEQQVAVASSAVKDSHKEVERLRKLVESKDTTLNQAEQESEELKIRNLELAQRLVEHEAAVQAAVQADHDKAQSALFSKNETISVLKQAVMDREEEGQMHLIKIQELESSLAAAKADTNGVNEIEDVDKLKQTIEEYEQQLTEKNKTIKMQQQRLADLKKTLQRELKMQNSGGFAGYDSPEELLKAPSYAPGMNNSSATLPTPSSYSPCAELFPSIRGSPSGINIPGFSRPDIREVNFQYLRHVIFKFMSSTDHEAKQLLKAVATLLEFTPHEEKLISKTLEWKTSWFGIKPSPKQTIQVNSLAYR